MEFTDSDSNEGDLKKLQCIWNNIQQTKQMKSKNNSRKEQIRTTANLIQIGNPTQHFWKSKQNATFLMQKLREADHEIEKLKTKINSLQSRSNQINDDDVSELQQTINELNLIIHSKDQEIARQELRVKYQEQEMDNLKAQIHHNSLPDLKLQSNTQACVVNHTDLVLELQDAHNTIERLIELLRNTQQFKHFISFTKDVKQIHFLSNVPNNLTKSKKCQTNYNYTCKEPKINQRLLWTQAAAYKIMLSMKIKHDYLSQDCIDEVLLKLNQIWLAREQSRVSKLKESHQTEVSKLRKKLQQKYDEVVAKKQIQRLKQELQGYRGMKKGKFRTTQKLRTLKNAGQYQDVIKLKDKEIKLLHERVKLLQTDLAGCNRQLYFEGALWVSNKLLQQMHATHENLQFFQNQLRNRMQQTDTHSQLPRFVKQLFQQLLQVNQNLLGKLVGVRQSLLAKMQ